MNRGVILCIVHQRTSYPARLGCLFMERGFALDVRCPHIGQTLPNSADGYAATVMFGGPQSAFEDHIPAIPTELRWLENNICRKPPFVGVCLGAQLLARALGAKVWRHPDERVEIGYTEIRPTQAGRPYFDGPMRVYQWHKDGFDLPEGATLLAAGDETFPNQCFRYDEHCYAMQFHPEVTFEMMCRWTKGAPHRLEMPGAMARDEQIRLHPELDPPFGAWAERFVDHVIRVAEARGTVAPLTGADATLTSAA